MRRNHRPASHGTVDRLGAEYADLIVSGDAHLLNLGRFHHIRIVTVGYALTVIAVLRE